MRAAPLSAAVLLLAARAAACPFGPPGHTHDFSAVAAASLPPMPEGRCTGNGPAPVRAPAAGSAPRDIKAHPLDPGAATWYALIDYRVDENAGRIYDPKGAVVTEDAWLELNRPFDASYERINATLWGGFMTNGYRLDESTCRLIAPDAKPLNEFSLLVWQAMQKRAETHMALETLLGRLNGLPPGSPVPEPIRAQMLALAQAGTVLPPRIEALLKRNGTTVGQLRGPAQASYDESTLFFDGQRTTEELVKSAVPVSGNAVESRRKPLTDPGERELGRTLGAGFEAQLGRTPVGRALLALFAPPNGRGLPEVQVLKLTQSPNDPQAPGAVYEPGSDRMIINYWRALSVLNARLPADRLAKIKDRLADASQFNALLKEDPSLLALIVDNLDVEYYHELTHAAQSRRGRIDDEMQRGNVPGANPLEKEQEAHRMHCVYLYSKSAAEIARSDWRDYCSELLRDPTAFKDRVTGMYTRTFSGSAVLDDVRARQEVREREARSLSARGFGEWIRQGLKLAGFSLGDKAIDDYRTDSNRREREFLATVPDLRSDAAGKLIAYYRAENRPDLALALLNKVPPATFADGRALKRSLAEDTVRWLIRTKGADHRGERLDAVGQVSAVYSEDKRALPPGVISVYNADAVSVADEILAKAVETRARERRRGGPVDRVFVVESAAERIKMLDLAAAWAKSGGSPPDLMRRIAAARAREAKK